MFEQRLLERLRALPEVAAASATNSLPMGTPSRLAFAVEGVAMPKIPIASGELVMPDYFEAMRIPLKSGRYLGRGDVHGSLPAVMVNETLAQRYFGERGAVGRRLKWGSAESPSPWLTIVGVTSDVRRNGLDQPDEPSIYFAALQQQSSDSAAGDTKVNATDAMLRGLSYVVRVKDDADLDLGLRDARRVVRELDPDLPIVALQRMTNVVDVSVAERRFNTLLLSVFALLALSLAMAGIYGLIAYSVVQRTREIGVRLAIGATPAEVLRLVVGQGTHLAALGVAIGLIGAAALTRLMRTLLFEVGPLDPASFIASAALLLAVAALASYLPARRASMIDPQSAIRVD
jgi:predicted permease